MGEAGGAPNVNKGMGLFSVKYGSMNEVQVRASTYFVPDILWSSYGDVGGTIKVNEDLRSQLAAQFAVQGSNGMNLLTGTPFSTFWGGFRADAFWGPLAFRVSYTQIGHGRRLAHALRHLHRLQQDAVAGLQPRR